MTVVGEDDRYNDGADTDFCMMTSAAVPPVAVVVVVGGGDRNKYRSSLMNSCVQSLIGGDGGESNDGDDFLGDVEAEMIAVVLEAQDGEE